MYDLYRPFSDRLNHSVAGGYPVHLEWYERDGSIRGYLQEPLASKWKEFYPEMGKDERIELFVGTAADYSPLRFPPLSDISQARELSRRIQEKGYYCTVAQIPSPESGPKQGKEVD